MADQKNVFISHVHEDDELVPKLKDLIGNAGMEVRDGSITSDKPNDAQNEWYIKREILEPRIQHSPRHPAFGLSSPAVDPAI